MSILEENKNFTSSEELNGPLQATVIGVEILFALVTNLFVLIFTLCHPKLLRQSSVIFLTNFVLANLLMATVYMPTIVVTASTGEWLFGESVEEKVASCKFVGFIFAFTFFVATFTLTAISVDRFLFIVKPFAHKRYMKTWTAVSIDIIVWISACLLTVTPFFGIGEYSFSESNSTCVPAWNSVDVGYVVFLFLVVMICVATIAVTSVWTFCFTHNFIKNSGYPCASTTDQKNMYHSRLIKIIGIFGAMLLVTAITYAPGAIACVVGFIITFEKLPAEVYASISVLFYTVTISNPIIQSYFRKELNDFIGVHFKKVFYFLRRFFCQVKQFFSSGNSNLKPPPLMVVNNKFFVSSVSV